MKLRKTLAIVLLLIPIAIIVGFVINNPYYWTILDLVTFVLTIIAGIVLIRE